MTKAQLIAKLAVLWVESGEGDKEQAHMDADNALIEYINDPEVTGAFNLIEKWYA